MQYYGPFVCLDVYPAAVEADECFIAQSAAPVKIMSSKIKFVLTGHFKYFS